MFEECGMRDEIIIFDFLLISYHHITIPPPSTHTVKEKTSNTSCSKRFMRLFLGQDRILSTHTPSLLFQSQSLWPHLLVGPPEWPWLLTVTSHYHHPSWSLKVHSVCTQLTMAQHWMLPTRYFSCQIIHQIQWHLHLVVSIATGAANKELQASGHSHTTASTLNPIPQTTLISPPTISPNSQLIQQLSVLTRHPVTGSWEFLLSINFITLTRPIHTVDPMTLITRFL